MAVDEVGTEARPETPTDLRLLPAALGAEFGAVGGLLLPGRIVVAALVLALAGALLVGRRAAAVLALLLVLAGSLAGAGLRVESRSSSSVHRAAEQGAAGRVDLVLTDDPRATRSSVAGDALRRPGVVVAARLVRFDVAGRGASTRQPVLVLAPADGWSELLPSQHVTASARFATPRGSDVAAVLLVRGPPDEVGPPSRWQTAAGSLRAGLRKASAGLPADARGLLPGLVVGDTSQMPADLTDDARAAGLSHLSAVSGANCAIVLALVLLLVRPTPLGRKGRAALAVSGLFAFVVLARPSPSVLRAAVMGGIALLALALGRPRSAVPALLGASTLLLLADPDLALAAGFLLSVIATGALLLLAPAWAEALEGHLPRRAAQALAIPLAAQVAVTPLVVVLSGTISVAAVPANLLAAPAVPVATVFGVVAACASPISPRLAALAAHVAGWPCEWIAGVAHRFAHVPGGSIAWPRSLVGAGLAVVVVVLLVAAVRRRRSRRLLAAVVCGLVFGALLVPRTLPTWPGPSWRMVVCDIGQGDALLVRGDDSSPPLLVDAGPDPRALRACLDRVGVRKLAAVVLSHLHADHVEGLPGALGHVATPAIYVNPLDEPALEGRRVRSWAARAGVPVTMLNLGQHLAAGAVEADVLGPVRLLHGTESDPNNDSLVLLARAGGLRLLLTGDVEPEGQAELLERGVPRVDVLKLPHHGSAHQDDRFLAASGARVAVASAGLGNVYGHPSPATLATVSRDGMRAMRTDTDGGVALSGSAGDPRVLPEKRSRPTLDAAERPDTQQRGLPVVREAALLRSDSSAAPEQDAGGADAARSAPPPRARPPPG